MPAPSAAEVEAATADNPAPYVKACVGKPAATLPLDGWVLWPDFPSMDLRRRASLIASHSMTRLASDLVLARTIAVRAATAPAPAPAPQP